MTFSKQQQILNPDDSYMTKNKKKLKIKDGERPPSWKLFFWP